MIDITNELLTKIKIAIPDATVLSSFQPTTSNFPTIVIEELDNSSRVDTKDSGGFQHSNIAFSVEIYTIGNRKMSDAKDIRNKVNNILNVEYGMARGQPVVVPNYLDDSIYRYRITYTGTISRNKTIYRG